MQAVITFIQTYWGTIATALFFLSEALAQIPAIKANSVFQLIFPYLQKYANNGQNPPST